MKTVAMKGMKGKIASLLLKAIFLTAILTAIALAILADTIYNH